MSREQFAMKGVLLCLAIVVFITANLLVVYCMNRDKDKASYFWMAVGLISGIFAAHLSKHF
jgi:nitrogen fixation/metabolism regulation signal transduction histidine kinase